MSDLEQTQAIFLEDFDEETDNEDDSKQKNISSYLKVICQKGFPEKIYPLYEGDNVIGRQEEACNIAIPLKALSRQHACIEIRGETHLIYDKGSRNKTKRGKLYLSPEVRYELKHNDQLTFGDVTCVYFIGQLERKDDEGSETESESDFQTAPAEEILGKKSPGNVKPTNVTTTLVYENESEEYDSEESVDLLQQTQAYLNNNGNKSTSTTLQLGMDSDEEDNDAEIHKRHRHNITVKDTPGPIKRHGISTVVLPESGSDTDDEIAPIVDISTVAVQDTQEDETAEKDVLYAPTQAYVTESGDEDQGDDTVDKNVLYAATQAYVTESGDESTTDEEDEATKSKLLMEQTQLATEDDIDYQKAPTQAFIETETKKTQNEDSKTHSFAPVNKENVQEVEVEVEESDEDVSHLFANPTLACEMDDDIESSTQAFGEDNINQDSNDANNDNDGTIPVTTDATVAVPDDATVAVPEDATVAVTSGDKEATTDIATVAITDDATVAVSDDATVAVSDDATVTVSDDANVAISDDATLAVTDDATVAVSDDATMAVSDDATMAVCNDASVAVSDDATVAVSDDATVAVSDDATVAVSDDATMAITDDATLAVTDNTDVSADATVAVNDEDDDTVEIEDSSTQTITEESETLKDENASEKSKKGKMAKNTKLKGKSNIVTQQNNVSEVETVVLNPGDVTDDVIDISTSPKRGRKRKGKAEIEENVKVNDVTETSENTSSLPKRGRRGKVKTDKDETSLVNDTVSGNDVVTSSRRSRRGKGKIDGDQGNIKTPVEDDKKPVSTEKVSGLENSTTPSNQEDDNISAEVNVRSRRSPASAASSDKNKMKSDKKESLNKNRPVELEATQPYCMEEDKKDIPEATQPYCMEEEVENIIEATQPYCMESEDEGNQDGEEDQDTPPISDVIGVPVVGGEPTQPYTMEVDEEVVPDSSEDINSGLNSPIIPLPPASPKKSALASPNKTKSPSPKVVRFVKRESEMSVDENESVTKENISTDVDSKPVRNVRGRRSLPLPQKGKQAKKSSNELTSKGSRNSTHPPTTKAPDIEMTIGEEEIIPLPRRQGMRSAQSLLNDHISESENKEKEVTKTTKNKRGRKSNQALHEDKTETEGEGKLTTSKQGRRSVQTSLDDYRTTAEETEKEEIKVITNTRGRRSAQVDNDSTDDKNKVEDKKGARRSSTRGKINMEAENQDVKSVEENSADNSGKTDIPETESKSTNKRSNRTKKGKSEIDSSKSAETSVNNTSFSNVKTSISDTSKRVRGRQNRATVETEMADSAVSDNSSTGKTETNSVKQTDPSDVSVTAKGKRNKKGEINISDDAMSVIDKDSENKASGRTGGRRGRKQEKQTDDSQKSSSSTDNSVELTSDSNKKGGRQRGKGKAAANEEQEAAEIPSKKPKKGTPSTPQHTKKADLSVPSPSLRRKSIDPKPKVLFTGVLDEQGQKIVKDLGGELVNSVHDCTHLVTDKVRRTVKFLCCLSRGLPIISPQWLNSCKDTGMFIDCTPFLVNDSPSEKQYKFSLKRSINKAGETSLLNGYKIHVTKSVKPDPQQMKEIIKCTGADFLNAIPKKSGENIVVISCLDDKTLCEPAMKAGIPIVNAEFLLTGILRQEAHVEDYKIFAEKLGQKRPRDSSVGAEPAKKRRR